MLSNHKDVVVMFVKEIVLATGAVSTSSPSPPTHLRWLADAITRTTATMEDVKYIGSFNELLISSEPADPRNTAIALCRLPVTRGLEPRYAFVFAGPDAEALVKLLGGTIEQIVQRLKTPT